MGLWFSVFFFILCLFNWNSNSAGEDAVVVKGTVSIDGRGAIGNIDDDFVCATLDWWPPEKCDYGTCSWGLASLLNLDLDNPILLNAVKAFSPLKLRLGGTLQDKLTYDTEDHRRPCLPFVRNTSELFGFSEGCLPLSRWDQLNNFFSKAGAKVIFGLNALAGRIIAPDHSVVGACDFGNAQSLIHYTLKKNYSIHGWELGNELSGNGIGAKISANQYASDLTALHVVIETAYEGINQKPLILGPGGFFDKDWFEEFIHKTTQSTNVITRHIYNLGPGVDPHLIEKILNPSYLDGEANVFRDLHNILTSSATPAVAWVGEAGGAYNSGHNLVTNAFVFSFWYLDQLGMASTFDTKTYCRQSLIGGNYGLLDTTTFVPNPDYYSALLWHRLMGRKVLFASFIGTKNIRAYAHCSKQFGGVTLLLLNLDSNTTVEVEPAFDITTMSLHHTTKIMKLPPRIYKEKVREEYHLTPKDGNVQSQTVLLNGNILKVSPSGEIPTFVPKYVKGSEPIIVSPLSIVFTYIPDVRLPVWLHGPSLFSMTTLYLVPLLSSRLFQLSIVVNFSLEMMSLWHIGNGFKDTVNSSLLYYSICASEQAYSIEEPDNNEACQLLFAL